MNPTSNALPRRNTLFLFALATIPILGIFCVYYFYSIAILKYAAAGMAALVLGLIFFTYPRLSFFVACFYIYSGLAFYFKFPVAYPIVMLAFFAVCMRHFTGQPIEMRDQMFNWSVAFFTLIALTSMLYARSPSFAILSFSKYAKVVLLTFLAIQLVKTNRDLERYALIIFLGSVMAVLFGLANLQLGLAKDLSVVGFAKVTRFEGTHVNPNRLAIYLATALPLGFYAVKRAGRLSLRILSAVGSFLLILAIFASFSRGALFPLVVVIIATLIREVRSRRVYFGIFLLVAVVILITPTYYWTRALSIGALIEDLPSDWSIYTRIQAAKSALNLFLENPLTGIGLNNYIVRSGSYLYKQIVSHNSYLELLSGVGLFGFIAWAFIMYSGARGSMMGMRHPWNRRDAWMKDLSFYLLLSIISSQINSMFLSGEFGYFLWMPLAGGLIAGNMVRKQLDNRQT